MGSSVIVDMASFEDEVIRKSFDQPVLVDFFAQWCGPCKMLKPMLEKLAQEYEFTLAKVDIDQNPDLANIHKVEGVPDVRVVVNGQMMPGFVGVLPEEQIRQLLAQLNLSSTLEAGLAELQAAQAAEHWAEVDRLVAKLMEHYPQDGRVLMAVAQGLLRHQRPEDAAQFLAAVPEHDKDVYRQAQALRSLLEIQPLPAGDTTDQDAVYMQAVRQAIANQPEPAMDTLLSLVQGDRTFRNDAARKTLILIFDLLGDAHPLTHTYRRKLMSALY
ncbi:MAG: tetratricopeptide repeat protein [Kaiparowitsia implicata GSE-PSE-MK54-09C]|jgi:putative thioredoxin|nr:tetratricopeptide repeat protein [Kaiparowitsia implicata GSE-PSE-MK54-09C]